MPHTHEGLIGTTVRHGSLVGKVILVTDTKVLIQPTKGNEAVAITIPDHLR